MQEAARARWLSAAASAAELGALKTIGLAYAKAAAYYREAAQLVPPDEEETLTNYLNEEGLAFLDSGKYREAQAPLERAMAIREKVLGPEHPNVVIVRENHTALLEKIKQQNKAQAATECYVFPSYRPNPLTDPIVHQD